MKMKTRNYTVLKLAGCIALAIVMLMIMALPAFADYDGRIGTDKDHQAEAAITKIFAMPKNTTTPASSFTFTFEKMGIDDVYKTSDPSIVNSMPALDNVVISYVAGDTTKTFEKDGVWQVVKESRNFVVKTDGSEYTWTRGEGIYKYLLKETQSGITIADATKEDKTYSDAWYNVDFWVAIDGDGELYVQYVGVTKVEKHYDEYYKEGSDDKVDPTPGYWYGETQYETIVKFSQLIFTNKYWKTNGEDKSLNITKTVTGNAAEKDKYFEFEVTVTRPEMAGTDACKAYVYDEAGKIVTVAANNVSGTFGTDTKGGYILFTSGTKATVKLMHGQRLGFVDLQVGSVVEVVEPAVAQYTASYERTFGKTGAFTCTAENTAWGFPRDPGDVGPIYTADNTATAPNSNTAAFTNHRTSTPGTGINLDNLPFIVLLVLAAAALVSYVVIKSRRNAKQGN